MREQSIQDIVLKHAFILLHTDRLDIVDMRVLKIVVSAYLAYCAQFLSLLTPNPLPNDKF